MEVFFFRRAIDKGMLMDNCMAASRLASNWQHLPSFMSIPLSEIVSLKKFDGYVSLYQEFLSLSSRYRNKDRQFKGTIIAIQSSGKKKAPRDILQV